MRNPWACRPRSRPTQAFIEWLQRRLPALQPGNRLPSVPLMSAQWHISPGTIRAVLREYQKQGKLVLIPGRGTFVPQEQPEVELTGEPGRNSAQSVVDLVTSSIQRGTLKLGEALPSVKYMALQFHVAPMTVVRAYRELQRLGLVVRVGKTFWAGSGDTLARPVQRRRAVLFNATRDFTTVFRSGWMAPAYHRFERELRAHGFALSYEPLDELARLAQSWRTQNAVPDALVFYELTAEMLDRVHAPLDKLRRRAQHMRLLMDWPAGDYHQLPRGPDTFVLSRGNVYTVRARAMAEFALRWGARRLYFCFDEEQNSFSTFLAVVRIRCELEALGGACRFVTLVRPLRGSRDPRAFFERLYAVRPQRQVALILSKYRAVSHTQLERETQFVRDVPQALAADTGRRLYLFLSDTQAIEARQAAARLRVPVPAQAGLVSLENDPQYLHEGITCCVPDWQQIGYLMAHALIGDVPVARSSKGFLRVRADVLERQST